MKKTNKAVFLLILLGLTACNRNGEVIRGLNVHDFFADEKTALLAASAAAGDVRQTDQILSSGIDVNSRGKDGMTPLLWAYGAHSKYGFQHLLERGANPNLVCSGGVSVLSFAVDDRNVWFLKTALKHGGDPNWMNPEKSQALIFDAVLSGNSKGVELLMKAGASLNVQNGTGDTPMMIAATIGRYDLAYAFLKTGADYTIPNNWGQTIAQRMEQMPLLSPAMKKWQDKVVSFLRERGVEVNPKR